MDYSSLRNYPVPKEPGPTDSRQNGGPCLNPRARRIGRDLVLLAAIVGLLIQLRQMTWAIQRPDLEHDPLRVYEAIPRRYEYGKLGRWCGLRRTPASAAEAEYARKVLLAAPDIEQLASGPPDEFWRQRFREAVRRPGQLRWERIHHPTDPAQWVGIAIWDQHTSGGEPLRWIAFRVPIGFAQ